MFCLYTLLKIVSYYDLSVLSMSVMMGFQKKFAWGCELHPVLFCNLFNFAKPLTT